MDPDGPSTPLARCAGRGGVARRAWLVALVLVCVATAPDAQGRRGRGRGQPFPDYPGRSKLKKEDWPLPETETKGKPQAPLPPIYLPGFDSPKKDSKEPAPVGPKPKANAKADPKRPPDPMTEADEITAAADHRAAVEEKEGKLLAEHFRLCDLDGGGWLSLREVEVTLSLDRNDFRRLDKNQDGRLSPAEFSAQGEQLLARLGAQPAIPKRTPTEPPSGPPAAEPAGSEEPARHDDTGGAAPATASAFLTMPVRPRDLLARYDADESSGLDSAEVEKLFLEAGLALSPELVVAQMDPDDSGQLESSELVAIAWMVSRHVPEALRPPPEPVAPPAEPAPDAGQRSAGLATHFGLLDEDADGFIDEADLRALQSPARLDLRFRMLLSAMDQDGDGRLSADEFRASMGAEPR